MNASSGLDRLDRDCTGLEARGPELEWAQVGSGWAEMR